MRAAIVFPGQGSQFVGMADPWTAHPAGQEVLDEAAEAMGRDLVAGCRDESALSTTRFAQPAILACDVAAFRVLDSLGAGFVGAAGHSLGEFAALVAAGVLSLADAMAIVIIRGGAMQDAGERAPGAMTALLGLGAAEANVLCDEARGQDVLVVANENSPQQVVISGSVSAIERAEEIAAARRVRPVRLKVAGAFHSPLMAPAVEPLSAAMEAATFEEPRFPLAANVSGELVSSASDIRRLLEVHVVSPVRWDGCAGALSSAGADTFVEAGPGDVLTKLAKRVTPEARAIAVGSPDTAVELLAPS